MSVLPAALSPAPGEAGLASDDLTALGEATVRAWDLFLDVAASVDPRAPARAKGWTAAEVIVHVGAWEESRRLSHILADAHEGRTTAVDHDETVAAILAAHADADLATALAAARLGRDEVAAWFASPDAPAEALLVTPSVLGPLPVATLLHATAYQLAIAALDLEPAGGEPSDELLGLGLVAVVDSAGALAARQDVTASLAALTPTVRVGTGATQRAWRTSLLADGAPTGPAIEAGVRTVLDVTAGRASAPGAYARGDLRVHDLTGLMRMARVVDGVPSLPGGTALRRAIGVMDAVGGVLSRLPFGRG